MEDLMVENQQIDFNKYIQEKEIKEEEEGFYRIFLVQEKYTGEKYFAKIIKYKDTSVSDRIFASNEVNLNAGMNHKCISKFFGYSFIDFQQESSLAIITEYFKNGSLKNFLQNQDKYSEIFNDTRKLIIIFGIASAMKYLHSNDILHCTLTPKNIYLDDNFYPKITNFYFSEKIHDLFHIDWLKGAPAYMAPEVYEAVKFTKFSDVYAFGIVLYEIITGKVPYENINIFQLFSTVLRGGRPSFDGAKPVKESYRDLIERCWSSDPERRPTFNEIVDELKTDKFITETIKKEDFLSYIELVENSPSSFNDIKIIKIEDSIPNQYRQKEKDFITKTISLKQYCEKPSFIKRLIGKKKLYPIDQFEKLNLECQFLVVDAEDNAELQFKVGTSLIEGENSFPKNIDLGVKYLERSMSLGYNESLLYLCSMLIKGYIIQQDLKRAKKYLLSIIKSDPRAYGLYGKLLNKENKMSEALQAFEKGSELGDLESKYKYSKMLLSEESDESAVQKARLYLVECKEKGHTKSAELLEWLDKLESMQMEEFKILTTDDMDSIQKVREISVGGSGHVIEVIWETVHALKEMNMNNFGIEKQRHFIGEYEMLCALHHPNIIIARGIFLGDETRPPSILLEFCPNNIEKLVKEKKLSTTDIAKIVYEIAQGMRYVHKYHIVHRDLKPSNILIGTDGHVRVSDFGISKLMTIEEQSTTLGGGTQKFMAPEILNENSYDEKADVYSFGVLLFFILSGGDMPHITVVQIGNGKKAKIPSDFTEFARNLIDRCWNFDPKTRPSFNNIVHELNEKDYKIVKLNETEVSEIRSFVCEHKKLLPKF